MDADAFPRLRPVLSVLVCGHRQARLAAQDAAAADPIRQKLRAVLDAAAAGARRAFARAGTRYDVADGPPLRVITGSLDGGDALAHDVVAAMDTAEHVVIGQHALAAMPAGLEAQSMVGFALPGPAPPDHIEALAREARDELALAHADVLVAIWDGQPAQGGRGGTVRLVHAAAQLRKPVVWIETGPHLAAPVLHLLRRATLLNQQLAALLGPEDLADEMRACFAPYDPAELDRELTHQLAPDTASPGLHKKDGETSDLDDIFQARLPPELSVERAGALDDMLWSLVGGDWARLRRNWQRLQVGTPEAQDEPDALYGWTDRMARVAAARHRVAAWAINIAAAFAVLFAVLGAGLHGGAWAFVLAVLEFACLAGILGAMWFAGRQRWHKRWLFCRVVAEQMRAHAMLVPLLGIAPAALRSPWRCSKSGLRLEDASTWLVHRWVVGLGFAPAGQELHPGAHQAALAHMRAQSAWMKGRHHGLEAQDHNLELVARLLLWATLPVVLLHGLGVPFSGVLVFTAFFPALGAAAANILKLAEVARVRDGYARTAQRLDELVEAIEAELRKQKEATSPERKWRHMMQVRRIALEAGRVLAEENQAWHDLLSHRTPAPP